jgi:hypothetical protein
MKLFQSGVLPFYFLAVFFNAGTIAQEASKENLYIFVQRQSNINQMRTINFEIGGRLLDLPPIAPNYLDTLSQITPKIKQDLGQKKIDNIYLRYLDEGGANLIHLSSLAELANILGDPNNLITNTRPQSLIECLHNMKIDFNNANSTFVFVFSSLLINEEFKKTVQLEEIQNKPNVEGIIYYAYKQFLKPDDNSATNYYKFLSEFGLVERDINSKIDLSKLDEAFDSGKTCRPFEKAEYNAPNEKNEVDPPDNGARYMLDFLEINDSTINLDTDSLGRIESKPVILNGKLVGLFKVVPPSSGKKTDHVIVKYDPIPEVKFNKVMIFIEMRLSKEEEAYELFNYIDERSSGPKTFFEKVILKKLDWKLHQKINLMESHAWIYRFEYVLDNVDIELPFIIELQSENADTLYEYASSVGLRYQSGEPIYQKPLFSTVFGSILSGVAGAIASFLVTIYFAKKKGKNDDL